MRSENWLCRVGKTGIAFAKPLALAAALAMAVSPALADCGAIVMPPEEFDHPPTTAVHIEFRPYFEVDSACRSVLRINAGAREEACLGVFAGTWLMFLPLTDKSVTSETQACLLRHEFAHLNGWLPSHPNARFD
jgi:hypothetical protein